MSRIILHVIGVKAILTFKIPSNIERVCSLMLDQDEIRSLMYEVLDKDTIKFEILPSNRRIAKW